MNALDYAKLGADTIMNRFTPEELPPAPRFHYHQGVFLRAVENIYNITGEQKYADYIKAWVDVYVKEDGTCLHAHDFEEFDDMQPGELLIGLYNRTEDDRYKKALDSIIDAAKQHPKNALGGFWHKRFLPNQMWLDSMYMAGMIITRYAIEYNEPYLIKVVHQQMRLMYDNIRNPKTGLLFHAWDDSRQAEWADPETGCSPEHWGRAMGWYAVATAIIGDILPDGNEYKQDFRDVAASIIDALIKYQDKETGLWYQLLDKGDNPDNWLESSCAALFAFAIARAVKSGIVDESYKEYALKAYKGVLSYTEINENNEIALKGVCIGTGVGDEAFYFGRPTQSGDLHGMGAFLLMCTEIYGLE